MEALAVRVIPKEKIPYLLELLDDESETVREALYEQFCSFGPYLGTELARLAPALHAEDKSKIHGLLAFYSTRKIKEQWPSWFDIEDPEEKLETALSLIAEFQNGFFYPVKLKGLLDTLTAEFLLKHPAPDPLQLCDYLFKFRGFTGVSEVDYYNPLNSNLVYVLQGKKGIPISLACIAILIAARLRLRVEGCSYPGHFLVRIYHEERMMLVDCFNGGRILNEEEVRSMNPESSGLMEEILFRKPAPEIIIIRVLNNLIRAYESAHQTPQIELMMDLLKMIQGESPDLEL